MASLRTNLADCTRRSMQRKLLKILVATMTNWRQENETLPTLDNGREPNGVVAEAEVAMDEATSIADVKIRDHHHGGVLHQIDLIDVGLLQGVTSILICLLVAMEDADDLLQHHPPLDPDLDPSRNLRLSSDVIDETIPQIFEQGALRQDQEHLL